MSAKLILKKLKNFLEKFFGKKIILSQSTICLIYSALIIFVYNSCFIFYKASILLNNSETIKDFSIFFLEIIFNFFVVFCLLYFASFKKIIFHITLFLLLFLSGIAVYTFNKFAVTINQNVVGDLIDNADNFDSVISITSFLFYFFIFIFLPFLFLAKTAQKKTKNHRTNIIILTLFLVLAVILGSLNHIKRKGVIFSYPPIKLVEASFKYYNEIYLALKHRKTLAPISPLVNAKIINKMHDLKVVLVIGESARAKNFSIYDYERKTSPHIEQIKNFLTFKNVEPRSNLTNYSVSSMLAYKENNKFQFPPKTESIIKIFENLNFSTSWFSTQKAFGDNNVLMFIGSQAQKFYFADKIASKIGGNLIYDEYLLDDLKQEVSKAGNSFIVLHTQGSHFLFHERYPNKFRIFTPDCRTKNLQECTKQQIVNSYDNSILYTDFFLDSVVRTLKDKNAILFYISDHGQFLGENNIYYHGPSESVTWPEHKVPMFLWMSDSLLQHKFYHEKFSHAAAKVSNKLSHDNLFDSLLDCSGIGYEKEKLSVCE